MSEYRQDDRNDAYCPVPTGQTHTACGKPLTGLTVAARGYCEQHGWQWAEWNKPQSLAERTARLNALHTGCYQAGE